MSFPLRGMVSHATIQPPAIPALSLIQPWAEAICAGLKLIETRGWGTAYRGRLAIHASKRMSVADKRFAAAHCMRDLPLGQVVAIVTLANCVRMRDGYEWPEQELEWGHFGPGRWAWILRDVERLENPVPANGSLGLWPWTPPAGIAA